MNSACFRVGVFGLVWQDGRVLLSRRRDSGWWNLPGGGVELGEPVDAAVIRELREETGLHVEVERLVGVYSKPQKNEVVLTFKCQVVGGTLIQTTEATEHAFVDPNVLPPRTLPKHADRIMDALQYLPWAIIRAQTEPSVSRSEDEESYA